MPVSEQSVADDTAERVTRVFADKMNVQVSSADADLFAEGVLDSLAFVDLLLHLEREFGVRYSLDDLEIDNFRSVTRIAEHVARAVA